MSHEDTHPTCVVCARPINKSGEFLYYWTDARIPKGVCGKPKKCRRIYEEDEADDESGHSLQSVQQRAERGGGGGGGDVPTGERDGSTDGAGADPA